MNGPLAHQFVRLLPQHPYRDGGAGMTIARTAARPQYAAHGSAAA